MDQVLIHLLNGLSAGLLLFMLSSGLTLIFSMMGVLNFAHASFYMLGAYLAWALARVIGFWPALLLAPLAVGLLGAALERWLLRPVHRLGHLPELMLTFGLSYVILEVVKLVWGWSPLPFEPPPALRGPAFTLLPAAGGGLELVWGSVDAARCASVQAAGSCATFPRTRLFMMGVALAMMAALALAFGRSRIGLLVRAALTQPDMLEALGHDVPRVFMGVFGAGCALAALAGVVGGISFVTEPSMAAVAGSIVFVVVVVGGLGSLAGAFLASLLIGLLQTLPLALDAPLAHWAARLGLAVGPSHWSWPLARLTPAQAAPVLPYLLMVLMLALRPRGLLGRRED